MRVDWDYKNSIAGYKRNGTGGKLTKDSPQGQVFEFKLTTKT